MVMPDPTDPVGDNAFKKVIAARSRAAIGKPMTKYIVIIYVVHLLLYDMHMRYSIGRRK